MVIMEIIPRCQKMTLRNWSQKMSIDIWWKKVSMRNKAKLYLVKMTSGDDIWRSQRMSIDKSHLEKWHLVTKNDIWWKKDGCHLEEKDGKNDVTKCHFFICCFVTKWHLVTNDIMTSGHNDIWSRWVYLYLQMSSPDVIFTRYNLETKILAKKR